MCEDKDLPLKREEEYLRSSWFSFEDVKWKAWFSQSRVTPFKETPITYIGGRAHKPNLQNQDVKRIEDWTHTHIK